LKKGKKINESGTSGAEKKTNRKARKRGIKANVSEPLGEKKERCVEGGKVSPTKKVRDQECPSGDQESGAGPGPSLEELNGQTT